MPICVAGGGVELLGGLGPPVFPPAAFACADAPFAGFVEGCCCCCCCAAAACVVAASELCSPSAFCLFCANDSVDFVSVTRTAYDSVCPFLSPSCAGSSVSDLRTFFACVSSGIEIVRVRVGAVVAVVAALLLLVVRASVTDTTNSALAIPKSSEARNSTLIGSFG